MTASEKLIYRLLILFCTVIGAISLQKSRTLSRLLGRFWYTVDKKHRRVVLDNLTQAFGREMTPGQIRELAEKVFYNTVLIVFEYTWFHSSKNRYRSDRIQLTGLEHLRKAHQKNKGVLVLTGHMGSWEVLTAVAPITGLPASVVYKTIESKPINRFVKENREKAGIKLYPLHNAFDAVYEALDRGELVGLLMDQNTSHARGVFIDFFGRKACANPGLVKLAFQTGAAVVPVFNYRQGDKIIIEIQPELPLIRTGNWQQDIFENTQFHHQVMEDFIRQHPDQWFWVHNRWKNRPFEEMRKGI
ncbi:MAG: lauroyl acyltransferase [Desulfobacteraceae bacterium]|nr:MAG: lauroyl acyltransferase [Desulfobacteraceae bacterium]